MRYERDMRGYGANPPDPKWPGWCACRRAVRPQLRRRRRELRPAWRQGIRKPFLSEIVWRCRALAGPAPLEHGIDLRIWRTRRLLAAAIACSPRLQVPITCYGARHRIPCALARKPRSRRCRKPGWEIASHGLKWIDYRDYAAEDERRDLEEAIKLHYEVTGQRPTESWYTGRSSVNTVRLAAQGRWLRLCARTPMMTSCPTGSSM